MKLFEGAVGCRLTYILIGIKSVSVRNACHQSMKQKHISTSTETQVEIDKRINSDESINYFLKSVYETVSEQLNRNIKNHSLFDFSTLSKLHLELTLSYKSKYSLGKFLHLKFMLLSKFIIFGGGIFRNHNRPEI